MSHSPHDRMVHAELPDGAEVVRYERAGKWYLEHPPKTGRKRVPLTLAAAVEQAVTAHSIGGKVFPRRPGGGQFDVRFRTLTSERADAQSLRVTGDDVAAAVLGAAQDSRRPQEDR